MANLPPKPESPVKDDRRPDGRDPATTARPMSQPRFRTDRLLDNDRSYVPRSRAEPDTYIAPYDARRPPRDWERDRDFDRRRDPPRRDSWRDSDRRDRPPDWRRDDDRFRSRRYDSAYSRSSRSPRRPSSSLSRYRSRSRSPPRRRSRSPRRFSRSISPRRSRSRTGPRRRAYSPRSRARASSRSRSPAPPKSPPSKRLKLGNHSISDSPPSRLHARSRSRTYSRSPRRSDKSPPPKKPASPALTSHPLSPKTAGNPPLRPAGDNEHAAVAQKITDTPAVKTDSLNPTTSVVPSLQEPPMTSISVDPLIKQEPTEELVRVEQFREEPTKTPCTPKLEMRGRSPSPPKGPRGMASQWRKNSKSPPKGPRNQSLITAGPIYPTGPRAGRRPQGPGTPVEQVQQATQGQEISKVTLIEQLDWRQGMVYDPGPKGRYGVGLLDLELARFQSHRVHLNKDYDQISRSTRRALHELDMATIDLRMAENRRRIADIQLEKAKHGMLGIDAAQSDLVMD